MQLELIIVAYTALCYSYNDGLDSLYYRTYMHTTGDLTGTHGLTVTNLAAQAPSVTHYNGNCASSSHPASTASTRSAAMHQQLSTQMAAR